MRNKRLILALTGAVLCGLLAVMLVTRYLANIQAYTRDLNNVVVAKSEIPLGAKITIEQLALIEEAELRAFNGFLTTLKNATEGEEVGGRSRSSRSHSDWCARAYYEYETRA